MESNSSKIQPYLAKLYQPYRKMMHFVDFLHNFLPVVQKFTLSLITLLLYFSEIYTNRLLIWSIWFLLWQFLISEMVNYTYFRSSKYITFFILYASIVRILLTYSSCWLFLIEVSVNDVFSIFNCNTFSFRRLDVLMIRINLYYYQMYLASVVYIRTVSYYNKYLLMISIPDCTVVLFFFPFIYSY